MATKVILPHQGLQMEEGTIVKWLVQEGETAVKDEPLFVMETDKTTVEVAAPATGTLLKLIRHEGEVVPVAETIAIIGQPGEDIEFLLTDLSGTNRNLDSSQPTVRAENRHPSAPVSARALELERNRPFVTPRAKSRAREKNLDLLRIDGSGPEGLIIERDVIQAFQGKKSTPLAKQMAELNGIDIAELRGTGPRGRVVRADVAELVRSRSARQHGEKGRLVPFTAMRRKIAERMTESVAGVPQANHRMEVDAEELKNLRGRLVDGGLSVTYNDILVKITALALKDHPMLNSVYTDRGVLVLDEINIGLAIAVEDGLVVPVIRNAASSTLRQIHAQASVLIEKARSGKIAAAEMSGGTFTISNLGMFDIDSFTAILNPPESAILAVGKIREAPCVKNGQVIPGHLMALSLTYDHRVADGAPAARFLQSIKRMIENPHLLLV